VMISTDTDLAPQGSKKIFENKRGQKGVKKVTNEKGSEMGRS